MVQQMFYLPVSTPRVNMTERSSVRGEHEAALIPIRGMSGQTRTRASLLSQYLCLQAHVHGSAARLSRRM